MRFQRGTGTISQELAHLQYWAENSSLTLDGPNGDDGMIREWQDAKAGRIALEKFVKLSFAILIFICGVPATLVSLAALGVIHLH